MFRTADGAGVSKIYLGGFTPAPVDRFGREQSEIAKTSLGAKDTVAWEQVEVGNELKLISNLKAEGYTVVAIEQTPKSISINDFKVPEKVAYILGNEIVGVQQVYLENCDEVVEIPMQGMKESLNVSVTAGIVLFRN